MADENKALGLSEYLKIEREKSGKGEKNQFGLAISGGGIRSATFALGILQSMATRGLLSKIDYLSTVSGGGYIGTWLSAWASRAGGIGNVEKKLVPRPEQVKEEADEIRWLRTYGSYLAPKTGLFSADTWLIFTIWSRNTILNLLVLAPFLMALLVVPWVFLFLHSHSILSRPQMLVVALLLLAVAALVYLSKWMHEKGESRGYLSAGIVCFSSILFCKAIWRSGTELSGWWPGVWVCAIFGGLISSYLMVKMFAGEEPETSDKQPKVERAYVRGLIGIACGAGVLATVYQLALHLIAAVDTTLAVALFAAPLFSLADCVILILLIGCASWRMRDEYREGWSRVAAWIGILSVAGWGVNALSFYGPMLVGFLRKATSVGIATGGLWLVVTGVGTWLAQSGGTSGTEKSKSPITDKLLPLAAVVFLLGLMVLLATGVESLLGAAAGAEGFWGHVTQPYATTYCDSCRKEAAPVDWATLWSNLPPIYECDAAHIADSWHSLALFLGLAGMFCFLSRLLSINEFSMHPFYRNRLVRAYLGASRGLDARMKDATPFTNLARHDDVAMADLDSKKTGFVHLICTAVNLNLEQTGFAERKASSYVFSPYGCGYSFPNEAMKEDAYFRLYPTEEELKVMMAGTAMTISGAAASPNMGYHTSPILAFLMTVFNVRLGYWMYNPGFMKQGRVWEPRGPLWGTFYYLFELFAQASSKKKYLYLSDGGHFENLAVYEQLQRRVKFIICIDGEEDGKFQFESLGGLLRKARSDMGIEIRIDTSAIEPKEENGWSGAHVTVGRIVYPDADEGMLLYLKLSVTGDEPQDILTYRKAEPVFPHQSTGDQFFTESQFESYRRLGLHVGETAFSAHDEGFRSLAGKEQTAKDERKQPHRKCATDLGDFFEDLWAAWLPLPRAVAEKFTLQTLALNVLLKELQETEELQQIGRQLTAGFAGGAMEIGPGDPNYMASFFFCQRLIQLMENVYVDLQLESNFRHPALDGWMRQFRDWAVSPLLLEVYGKTKHTFGVPFQSFFERRLKS